MSVGTDGIEHPVDVRIRPAPSWPCTASGWTPPCARPEGAGPSDDGHVLVDGANAALPINPDSPYTVRDGRVLLGDGRHRASPSSRCAGPGSTTCPPPTACRTSRSPCCTARTCSPRPSCRPASGTPSPTAAGSARSRSRCGRAPRSRRRRPAQLAEVAEAAVRLDGVRQMVMTTGTTAGPRPRRPAPRPVRAGGAGGRARPADPGAVEPPGDLAVDRELRDAGADRRSASTSSRSTTRYGGAGCRASRPCRWPSTRRRGTRRSGCSAATGCRRTCWSGSARTPTSWSRARAG